MEKIDILVKNGHILDPAAGVDGPGCLGINNGLSLGLVPGDTPARRVVDAAGCYVLPGLIDFHTHLNVRGSSISVDPNMLIPMGVTTAADAGTTGCLNFRSYHSDVVAHSALTIRTYLNVSSIGQLGDGFEEDFDPSRFCLSKIKALAEEFPDHIRGLKIRMEAPVMGGWGMESLGRAKEIASELGLPLVVHAANPPIPEAELLSVLGKGDVMCHCYHGKNEHTILDENGKVRPEVRHARERGVIFDLANGITNYSHDVAIAAIADGFLPDIISSDLSANVFNNDGYGKSMPYTMSKMLRLGMSLEDVVKASTATPARELGLEGRAGTLAKGAWGDAAILKLKDADTLFLDSRQKKIQGNSLLIPQMTIKSGKVLFRQCDF